MKKTIILFIFFIIFLSCSKKSGLPASISFLIGQVTHSKENQNFETAKIKDNVADKWVKTDKNSICEVNLTHHLIKMIERTTFNFKEIYQNKTALELNEGLVYIKGIGVNQSPFFIRTPAVNISVRGTELSVSVKKDAKGNFVTKVQVKSGQVAVSRNIEGLQEPETLLNPGEKCEVSEKENWESKGGKISIKAIPQTPSEKYELAGVDYQSLQTKELKQKSFQKYEPVKNRGKDDLEDSLRK